MESVETNNAATQEAIRDANAEFYNAVEARAMDRLDAVWSHEDHIRCIHPGWDVLVGWARVRESWERIFENNQQMRITPTNVHIYSSSDFAWVICIENITLFQESSFDSIQAAATNLFVYRNAQWLLVHHHASPIPILVAETAVSDTIQ
jgi:ketosteroid isomerase-like protein